MTTKIPHPCLNCPYNHDNICMAMDKIDLGLLKFRFKRATMACSYKDKNNETNKNNKRTKR